MRLYYRVKSWIFSPNSSPNSSYDNNLFSVLAATFCKLDSVFMREQPPERKIMDKGKRIVSNKELVIHILESPYTLHNALQHETLRDNDFIIICRRRPIVVAPHHTHRQNLDCNIYSSVIFLIKIKFPIKTISPKSQQPWRQSSSLRPLGWSLWAPHSPLRP